MKAYEYRAEETSAPEIVIDEYAAKGWRLHSVIFQWRGEDFTYNYLVIFEREREQ